MTSPQSERLPKNEDPDDFPGDLDAVLSQLKPTEEKSALTLDEPVKSEDVPQDLKDALRIAEEEAKQLHGTQ